MPGVTVKDVNSHAFVKAYAAYLKRTGKLDVPKWVDIVKTGTAKELAPLDSDWFYMRVAALARRVYVRPETGVGAYKKVYGSRVNRGSRPHHHRAASGSVIRKALQALEKIKVVEKHPDGGRRITQTGQKDLDRIAAQILKKDD
ncbi:40S ribosomal protein S19 [Clydaea vesicula]|uniref:40S ribosomal protein S19 n=1 Tax=Clydaea vesicula TaxID=447962 RepID=A0AAD5XWG4_9FUNG|nr:40S ribosomal protein S19 [Clydaea vesicula]KAJ3395770.1 40S ribosomal protein S19 [Lobulomyces angularis]